MVAPFWLHYTRGLVSVCIRPLQRDGWEVLRCIPVGLVVFMCCWILVGVNIFALRFYQGRTSLEAPRFGIVMLLTILGVLLERTLSRDVAHLSDPAVS